MAQPPRMDLALKRLRDALDGLDAATARVGRTKAARPDASPAASADDRDALAGELDAARARTRELEQAAADVAERLGKAGSSLRRLLAAEEDA